MERTIEMNEVRELTADELDTVEGGFAVQLLIIEAGLIALGFGVGASATTVARALR